MTSRPIKKAARERGAFFSLLKDRKGAFAIMTALLLPLFVLLLGVLFEGGRALVYYNQSKRVMALACERSTKPTRTDTPEDEDRREAVLTTFDSMIQSTKQKVITRDVVIDWLRTDMKAEFGYNLLFAKMLSLDEFKYRLNYTCQGIPPYPYDGEVLVNNDFEKTSLDKERVLKNGVTARTPGGCWGVYRYTEIRWDGGTDPGIELQDWSSPCCRKNHDWDGYPDGFAQKVEKDKETLNDKACDIKDTDKAANTRRDMVDDSMGNNASLPTRYVIELDSDWGAVRQGGKKPMNANSSIFKKVELHPGYYEISVWYNGRKSHFKDPSNPGRLITAEQTNGIDVTLQQLLPQLGAVKPVFNMRQGPGMENPVDQAIKWRYYQKKFTVDTYSVYKLTIAASGFSDSVGGIITGFELRYIGRYGDERR